MEVEILTRPVFLGLSNLRKKILSGYNWQEQKKVKEKCIIRINLPFTLRLILHEPG